MRRSLLLLSCWCAVLWGVPPPVHAELRIEAPPAGFVGETVKVAVSGTAPYGATLFLGVQQGAACDDAGWSDSRAVNGPFREEFEASSDAEGAMLLCARTVGPDQRSDGPTLDRGAATVTVRRPELALSLQAVRSVVGTDETVRLRLTGVSETESAVWGWARLVDGAPCQDIPRVAEQTHWGWPRGAVDRVVTLGPIAVPGTYRVCAQVFSGAYAPEPFGTIETQVIVSQACTDARRSRARRTAAYRRARAAYRRARGARRARARRVMIRRKAAMDRARGRVGADC